LQPLDVVMFSLFANAYRKKVREYGKYAHLKVSKIEFLRYLQPARDEAFTESNFKAAFAAAGLIPWDSVRVIKKIDLKYAQVLKRYLRDYIPSPISPFPLRNLGRKRN
jgi:hypothetical protein